MLTELDDVRFTIRAAGMPGGPDPTTPGAPEDEAPEDEEEEDTPQR